MTVQPIRLFGDPVLRTPADAGRRLRQGTAQAGQGPGRDDAGRGRRRPRRPAARRRPAGVRVRRRRRGRAHRQPGAAASPTTRSRTARRAACPSRASTSTPSAGRTWWRTGFNEYGDPVQLVGTGLMARCVQHETDHLDGVLFLDRLDAAARKEAMKQIRAADWYDAGRAAGGQGQPARPRHLRAGAVTDAPRLRRHAGGRAAHPGRHRRVRARAGRRGHPPGRAGRPGPPRWSARRPAPGPTSAASRCSPRSGRASRSSWTGCGELAPDCVPVVAYGALVPPAALEIPAHGWVNLHFSLLPAWRGAAPVQHAVLHGDEVTGASVFELEAGLDTGPVYGTLTEDDPARATPPATCWSGSPPTGAGLLVAVLDAIEAGTARAHAAAGRRRHAGAEAHRRGRPGPLGRPGVRGGPADPRLHARRRARGRRCAATGSSSARCAPVAERGPRSSPASCWWSATQVLAGTATTPVALGEVRAAGKKPMPAADWARGAAPRAGGAASSDRRSTGRPAARLRARAAGEPAGRVRAGTRDRPGAVRGPAGRRPTRPGRRRTRRSRRCTATTRTRTWCCPTILREHAAARPGRGVRHRADLRHAARARHPRPDHRGGGRPRRGPHRPAGPRRAAARRLPAAATPGCRRTPRSTRPSTWCARWRRARPASPTR